MTSEASATIDERARPYGLVGLTVGVVVILVVMVVLFVVALAAAFGVAGLALGWHEVLGRLADLKARLKSDPEVVKRVGIVLSLVVYATLSLAVLGAAYVRAGRRWRDIIGWHEWSLFRRSRLFWAVAAASIVYNVGSGALVAYLYPPARDWIVLPTGALWIGLFVVLAVVFAPVAEELLFRGWLYTGLRPAIGVWPGIIVSAVLFALAHWESTHIYALTVFPVGLVLGFIRERTGSLKASMAFHAVFNAAASVLLVSGF